MRARVILSISLVLVVFLGFTALPALALYAPCPAVTATVDSSGTIVTYVVTDPTTGFDMSESYTLNLGQENHILDLQVDNGMVTWINSYKNNTDTYYTLDVQYRIYDPGRGQWRGDHWGIFAGFGTMLSQHQVKDGVIAWRAQRQLGPNSTDDMKYYVCYVTYEPESGTWPFQYQSWQEPYNSPVSPENPRVKDGVVAWPMNPLDADTVPYHAAVFDRELKQWNILHDFLVLTHGQFDWISIIEGTVRIHSHFAYYDYDAWYRYDPLKHLWEYFFPDRPDPIRRAAFVAQPNPGYAPQWVCFWDTSFAFDPAITPWTWSFNYGDGGSSPARSPLHYFNNPGTFSITQTVAYGSLVYNAAGTVVMTQPPPPTGSISINGGGTYATSFNVTLHLKASADATEMCFYQTPGLVFWGAWRPYQTSLAWQLSQVHILGQSADGPHTVYVKFRNAALVESDVYQATINVDTTAPAGSVTINGGQARTGNPKLNLTLAASDANGVTKMRFGVLQAPFSSFIWSPWENYQTAKTLPCNTLAGKKQVFVQFQDVPGNVSQGYEASILLTKPLPVLQLLLD